VEIKEKMRLIKKHIGFFFLFLSLLSCNAQEDKANSFFLPSKDSSTGIEVNDPKEVVHIKNNIYKYNNKLYFAQNYFKKQNVNNGIKVIEKGLFLIDSTGSESIDNILDLKTYKQLREYSLYTDKNNVYYSTSSLEYATPPVFILELNPLKLRIIDKSDEYISDDQNVYCLRNGKKILTNPEKFKIIEIDGIVFGIDSKRIYSMCEPMSPKDFIENFENISLSVKDSIIREYIK